MIPFEARAQQTLQDEDNVLNSAKLRPEAKQKDKVYPQAVSYKPGIIPSIPVRSLVVQCMRLSIATNPERGGHLVAKIRFAITALLSHHRHSSIVP